MRFSKKKLMKKSLSALQAVAFIEGIDITGLSEITQESVAEVIVLMASDVYPHSGPPPSVGPPPITQAPNQDTGVSLRIQRIRDSQES